jgi:ketosteroid isomerase-like protein
MTHIRVRSIFLAALLLALLSPWEAAQAQVPGGRPGANLSRFRAGLARVRAEAMVTISRQLADWQDAWTEDDFGALGQQYGDSARIQLVPDGRLIEGRKAIESTYRDLLPGIGSMSLQIKDFDAGENLAFVLGDYRYYAADGHTEGGVFVMSLRRSGHDRWRIQSQLFAPSRADAPATVQGDSG